MRILILDNSMKIHKRIYETEPIGGSELNLLLLSEALSLLNHTVFLLCNTDNPDLSDSNFILDHNYNFEKYLNISDVIIFYRLINTEAINKILSLNKKPILLFYTEDAYDQAILAPLFDKRLTNDLSSIFRYFITVSEWQANTLSLYSGISRDKFIVFPNCCFKIEWTQGYDLREERSLIFASVPYKGLEFVFYIFNDIVKELNDDRLKLYCFSSLNLYKMDDNASVVPIMEAMKRDPMIHYEPVIDVITLHSFFKKAKVYIHPSTYHETFCISIAQAQACGCIPVVPSVGALPERVIDGYNGFIVNCCDIRNYECYDLYKNKIKEAITSDLYSMSINAQASSKKYDYIKVASDFARFLEGLL